MNTPNIAQIASEFFTDTNPDVRKHALQMLSGGSDDGAESLLVEAMDDPVEAVWTTAVAVLLSRYPWLILRPSFPQPLPDEVLSTSSGRAWQRLNAALHRYAEKERKPRDLERWCGLPGAIPDLTEALLSHGREEEAAYLRKTADVYVQFKNDNRQVLLAPTYACNLNCTYCYTKGWNGWFKGEMSSDALRTALTWCAKQDVGHIILCGGEPTVYGKFRLLTEAAKKWNMKLSLTTNLLYSTGVQESVLSETIAEIIAHYDQSLIDRPDLAKRFYDNLKIAAAKKSPHLYLRYTLTDDSTREEWARVIALAREFNIDRIHYAFAFKNILGNNESVQYETERELSSFETLFSAFVSDCAAADMGLHLCKPIPFCALSEKRLATYLLTDVLRPACGAYLRDCTQNVTINPDLSTFPCNAIGVRGPKITEFKNLEEVSLYYESGIRALLFHPYCNECQTCLYYYRGYCQGVCMAEKYTTMTPDKRKHVFKSDRQ